MHWPLRLDRNAPRPRKPMFYISRDGPNPIGSEYCDGIGLRTTMCCYSTNTNEQALAGEDKECKRRKAYHTRKVLLNFSNPTKEQAKSHNKANNGVLSGQRFLTKGQAPKNPQLFASHYMNLTPILT